MFNNRINTIVNHHVGLHIESVLGSNDDFERVLKEFKAGKKIEDMSDNDILIIKNIISSYKNLQNGYLEGVLDTTRVLCITGVVVGTVIGGIIVYQKLNHKNSSEQED